MSSSNDQASWWVYMIHCSDDSFYTGISTDIERRFKQHATQRGARYFRGRAPVEIVFSEGGHDRSSASRREYEIKQLGRQDKVVLIQSSANLLSS